jgi:hypothetical protein
MADEIKINFENEFIKRFTTLKKYRYVLIVKILAIVFFGLYVALFINPKAKNLSLEIRIIIPILVLGLSFIFLFISKFTSSLVFNKLKNEVTINYFQYLGQKSITTSFENIEYYMFEMKDSLYNSRNTKFLTIFLSKDIEFKISASNLKNSGLDYDSMLKFFEENGFKRYERDFLLEDELDKTL